MQHLRAAGLVAPRRARGLPPPRRDLLERRALRGDAARVRRRRQGCPQRVAGREDGADFARARCGGGTGLHPARTDPLGQSEQVLRRGAQTRCLGQRAAAPARRRSSSSGVFKERVGDRGEVARLGHGVVAPRNQRREVELVGSDDHRARSGGLKRPQPLDLGPLLAEPEQHDLRAGEEAPALLTQRQRRRERVFSAPVGTSGDPSSHERRRQSVRPKEARKRSAKTPRRAMQRTSMSRSACRSGRQASLGSERRSARVATPRRAAAPRRRRA